MRNPGYLHAGAAPETLGATGASVPSLPRLPRQRGENRQAGHGAASSSRLIGHVAPPQLLLALGIPLLFQAAPVRAANPVVRITTELGSFEIELCNEVSPLCPSAVPSSVENFLNYVQDGDYEGSVIHLSGPGFIIQGGGFRVESDEVVRRVPQDPPILDEFNRSNLRGTVNYARTNVVDSATSQWFVNVGDDIGLDTQNEGFTVFGVVRVDGMQVVDEINMLPLLSFFNPDDGTFLAIFEELFDPVLEVIGAFGSVLLPQEIQMRASGQAEPLPSLSEFAEGLISTDVTLVLEPGATLAGASALGMLAALARRRRSAARSVAPRR